MKHRLALLQSVPFINENWSTFTVDQIAFLLRDADIDKCTDQEYLMRQVRFFRKRKLLWR